MIIGLTGPTGSGKSSASAKAHNLGFTVVDCDKLARVAVEKGSEGLNALVMSFGDDILNGDKTLNRKMLARKAFSTPEKTELLNRILLPYIVKLVLEQAVGDRVLLDAPTLFESGLGSMCDVTIAVLSDTKIRLERIIKRDSLDKESALLRINAGKADKYYKENADYIIYNNDTTEKFLDEFVKIIHRITVNN